ncbi:hypothetical protein JW777_10935 [bacterium]|nr:hypothetical protein [bacterium]
MKGRWILLMLVPLCAEIPAHADDPEDGYRRERQAISADGMKKLIVEVDVSVGELRIGRNPGSDSLIAELEYKGRDYRSKIDLDAEKGRALIRLKKRDWRHGNSNRDDRPPARVTVLLPSGPETVLEARLKAGEADLQLGGLRLRETVISIWAGELDLDFDRPNLIPMDYLEVNPKIGEASLRNLANARSLETDIDAGIGELTADFRGAAEPDSRVRIDHDIGETTVLLPDSAAVRYSVGGVTGFMSHKILPSGFTDRGRYRYSDDFDRFQNRSTFIITPGLGELRVDRRN